MNIALARKLIGDVFNQSFDRERYQRFLQNLLNDFVPRNRHYAGNLIPDAYKQHVSQYWRLGKYVDPQGEELDLLVVEVKNRSKLERARATLRTFAVNRLETFEKQASLIAFYANDDQGADWRFSFVKMEETAYKDDAGKVKLGKEITPAKRYSFLVGEHESSHTAQSRLVSFLENDQHDPTLEEIENAFNIESVTKEFFLEYRTLFLHVKKALDAAISENPAAKADFDKKGVDTVNFAKKLLGQIVFLYFLQKKAGSAWEKTGPGEPGLKTFCVNSSIKSTAHTPIFSTTFWNRCSTRPCAWIAATTTTITAALTVKSPF